MLPSIDNRCAVVPRDGSHDVVRIFIGNGGVCRVAEGGRRLNSKGICLRKNGSTSVRVHFERPHDGTHYHLS